MKVLSIVPPCLLFVFFVEGMNNETTPRFAARGIRIALDKQPYKRSTRSEQTLPIRSTDALCLKEITYSSVGCLAGSKVVSLEVTKNQGRTPWTAHVYITWEYIFVRVLGRWSSVQRFRCLRSFAQL
jgi:hypothetical protein